MNKLITLFIALLCAVSLYGGCWKTLEDVCEYPEGFWLTAEDKDGVMMYFPKSFGVEGKSSTVSIEVVGVVDQELMLEITVDGFPMEEAFALPIDAEKVTITADMSDVLSCVSDEVNIEVVRGKLTEHDVYASFGGARPEFATSKYAGCGFQAYKNRCFSYSVNILED